MQRQNLRSKWCYAFPRDHKIKMVTTRKPRPFSLADWGILGAEVHPFESCPRSEIHSTLTTLKGFFELDSRSYFLLTFAPDLTSKAGRRPELIFCLEGRKIA